MNNTEAQSLIAYLNRAGLVGAMEGQSAVWADALDDVRFVDAQEAARGMVRSRRSTERWVTPGDVREQVSLVRKDRLNDALQRGGYQIEPPDTDDWRAQTEWNRRFRALLADGLTTDEADATACREVGLVRPAGELVAKPIGTLKAQIEALTRTPR